MKYKMLIIGILLSFNLYSQNTHKYVRVKEVGPFENNLNVVWNVVIVDSFHKADMIVMKSVNSFQDDKAIRIKIVQPYSYEGRKATKIYIRKENDLYNKTR